MSIETKRTSYRPEIDGLRAISVLAVIVFHSGLGIPGGFVGVDVFFVISGYLITRIVADEIEDKRFSLIGFWERRIRRIFPAVALVQLTVLTVAILLYLPLDFRNLSASSVFLSLNLPNVNYWRSVGYFSDKTIVRPLLHTWSLGVEEQFYLCFPLLAVSFARFSAKNAIRAFVVIAIMSFSLNMYLSYQGDVASAFYLLPGRAWELMVGCILALANPFRSAKFWKREALSAFGMALILASMLMLSERLRFPGLWAVVPVLGSGIFIAANTERRTFVGRMLSHDSFLLIGKMSFSLYLWHWPLTVIPTLYFPDYPWVVLVFISSSFPIAYLSWSYVEEPFRRRKVFASRKAIFGFYGVASCAMIALSVFGIRSNGMSFRANLLGDSFRTKLALGDTMFESSVPEIDSATFIAGGSVGVGSPHVSAPSFLVWGDSHAVGLAGAIDRSSERNGVKGLVLAKSGTPPLSLKVEPDPIVRKIDSMRAFGPDEELRGVADRMKSLGIRNLLLIVRWDLIDDVDRIVRMLDQLADLSKDLRIYVVEQFPLQRYGARTIAYQAILAETIGGPFVFRTTDRTEYDRMRKPVIDALNRTKNRNVVRIPVDAFCFDENDRLVYRRDGKLLYFDDDHLSAFGAGILFEPIVDRLIERIKADRPVAPDSQPK